MMWPSKNEHTDYETIYIKTHTHTHTHHKSRREIDICLEGKSHRVNKRWQWDAHDHSSPCGTVHFLKKSTKNRKWEKLLLREAIYTMGNSYFNLCSMYKKRQSSQGSFQYRIF